MGIREFPEPASPDSSAVYNVAMPIKDTEYSQVIPAGTQCISFHLRANKNLRFAFEAGKVAGPVAPYATVKSGAAYNCDGLDLRGPTTLYVASPDDVQTLEIVIWS